MAKQTGRILKKEWNDNLAEWQYVLYEVSFQADAIEGTTEEVANGDAEWAQRTARHYNLSIEGEGDE